MAAPKPKPAWGMATRGMATRGTASRGIVTRGHGAARVRTETKASLVDQIARDLEVTLVDLEASLVDLEASLVDIQGRISVSRRRVHLSWP